MPHITPRIASGFVEYLPAEQIEFNRLLDIIRRTYEKYGFSPIDTPDMELSEVLLAKEAGETGKEVYRFEKGRNDFTLRFDLTVPLARYTAQHESELVMPFRRYHIGKVHRAERAQAGRFREFYQCDIDVIGSKSPLVDAEFPAVINEIFEQCNFGEFTIRLNDRRILNGFFESIGLSSVAAHILRIIDKMEKITRDELIAELKTVGLDNQQVVTVLDFTAISGSNDQILEKLRQFDPSAQLTEGISHLSLLVNSLRSMGVPESRFQIDLRIARGLDYYTGTVYETILDDHREIGSVCSGGRYDNLAAHYTKSALPGVGISIGLSRLFYKLRQAGIITPTKQSVAEVAIMPFDDAQAPAAIGLASTLRQAGIATILYTEPNKLNQKLRYADRMGFRHVVLLGDREVSTEVATVKDMKGGTSEDIPFDQLAAYLEK